MKKLLFSTYAGNDNRHTADLIEHTEFPAPVRLSVAYPGEMF
jgi:hypothetical protein